MFMFKLFGSAVFRFKLPRILVLKASFARTALMCRSVGTEFCKWGGGGVTNSAIKNEARKNNSVILTKYEGVAIEKDVDDLRVCVTVWL